MSDEPQDTTEDPEAAGDAAAEEAAVDEPSPSGVADDDTSSAGGEGTGPDVTPDEEGVATGLVGAGRLTVDPPASVSFLVPNRRRIAMG